MAPCLWGWIGGRIWEMSVQNESGRRLLTIRPPVLRGSTVPQYQKREKRTDISAIRNNIGSRLPVYFRCPKRLLDESAGVVTCSLTYLWLAWTVCFSLCVSWWDRCTSGFPRELTANAGYAICPAPCLIKFSSPTSSFRDKLFWVESEGWRS